MDDPEKVLGEVLREKFQSMDDFGLNARVAMRLPNDAFDVTLELALGVTRAFEFLSEIVRRLGRVVAEDRTGTDASLQAVIGAGFLNKMPAVVMVRISEIGPSRSKVVIAGISKEGLIKQRAGEGAVRRILKAANLPAPGGLPNHDHPSGDIAQR